MNKEAKKFTEDWKRYCEIKWGHPANSEKGFWVFKVVFPISEENGWCKSFDDLSELKKIEEEFLEELKKS